MPLQFPLLTQNLPRIESQHLLLDLSPSGLPFPTTSVGVSSQVPYG